MHSFYFTAVPCTDLVIPNNGAILCNGWDTDIINLCVLVCKSGYSVPLGYSEDVVYVCGSSGNWSPAGSLPECIGKNLKPILCII